MGKRTAAKKTASARDDIEHFDEFSRSLGAKQQFLSATLTLSWRLALTVLIPLIAGIQIDKRFDTNPSFTLTGFMLAIVFGCMAVWQTVREVNQAQAEAESRRKKGA